MYLLSVSTRELVSIGRGTFQSVFTIPTTGSDLSECLLFMVVLAFSIYLDEYLEL